MAELQARLQSLSEDYQKLQQGKKPHVLLAGWLLTARLEVQDAVASRQKLEGQKQENLGVKMVF